MIDEVYQRVAVSGCLNSPRRMVRAGCNAKEIMIPKIEITELGDYTSNVGYRIGSNNYEFETKTFNYDRGIRLLFDVMYVEKAGVFDCFVEAGSELQRVQAAPEADAFTFAELASHEGVATSEMDRLQVATASRILFFAPTLKGVLDDFSQANPARSNQVLTRISRSVEVPQVRFFTAIDLLSGEEDKFGYRRAAG